jgi:hypothetical protein
MTRRLNLFIKDIKEIKIAENFRRVADFLRDDPFSRGRFDFYKFDLKLPSYPGTVEIPHHLPFIPTDIITTSAVGGDITWLYDSFTSDKLYADITASVRVRAYIGAYSEGRTV